jgi:hypothetical protein
MLVAQEVAVMEMELRVQPILAVVVVATVAMVGQE